MSELLFPLYTSKGSGGSHGRVVGEDGRSALEKTNDQI